MRSTYNAEPILNGAEFIGISLGADYCAEHEWGIQGLERSLGIDRSKLGIEGRQATNGSKIGLRVGTSKKTKFAQLYTKQLNYRDGGEAVPEKPGFIPSGPNAKYLDVKWDERDFHIDAFNINGNDAVTQLKTLKEAADKNDIAMWMSGCSNPFGRGGLVIAIVSKIPQEYKDGMLKADKDHILIKETMANTGIEEILAKADCKYFALSPRWISDKDKDRSKCPLIFWLNPYNQDRVNFGWFTLEELIEWSQGKGKIPMSPEQIAERNKR